MLVVSVVSRTREASSIALPGATTTTSVRATGTSGRESRASTAARNGIGSAPRSGWPNLGSRSGRREPEMGRVVARWGEWTSVAHPMGQLTHPPSCQASPHATLKTLHDRPSPPAAVAGTARATRHRRMARQRRIHRLDIDNRRGTWVSTLAGGCGTDALFGAPPTPQELGDGHGNDARRLNPESPRHDNRRPEHCGRHGIRRPLAASRWPGDARTFRNSSDQEMSGTTPSRSVSITLRVNSSAVAIYYGMVFLAPGKAEARHVRVDFGSTTLRAAFRCRKATARLCLCRRQGRFLLAGHRHLERVQPEFWALAEGAHDH